MASIFLVTKKYHYEIWYSIVDGSIYELNKKSHGDEYWKSIALDQAPYILQRIVLANIGYADVVGYHACTLRYAERNYITLLRYL